MTATQLTDITTRAMAIVPAFRAVHDYCGFQRVVEAGVWADTVAVVRAADAHAVDLLLREIIERADAYKLTQREAFELEPIVSKLSNRLVRPGADFRLADQASRLVAATVAGRSAALDSIAASRDATGRALYFQAEE